MPWGYVAGKWWGDKTKRPVLALHGWQDNAGSFDTLIPLLPDHVGYLAIDLPGHGLSSHFPAGMTYSTVDFVLTIELIRRQFNWDRMSLMAHSMGSQISFYYLAARPDICDMAIGIDVLKPLVRTPQRNFNDFIKVVDKMLVHNSRSEKPTPPPSYTREKLIELMFDGTKKSVSRETAPYLLTRSVQESSEHPGKYFFRRDNRLKVFNYAITFHELNLHMAKQIVAPYLFIKATNAPYFEDKKYFDETICALQTNPQFELMLAEGTHHIHLTEPTKISGKVSEFILKNRANDQLN